MFQDYEKNWFLARNAQKKSAAARGLKSFGPPQCARFWVWSNQLPRLVISERLPIFFLKIFPIVARKTFLQRFCLPTSATLFAVSFFFARFFFFFFASSRFWSRAVCQHDRPGPHSDFILTLAWYFVCLKATA